MKQKLLLSELDMKKLRDKVQRLQNELTLVSQGSEGRGKGTWEGVSASRRERDIGDRGPGKWWTEQRELGWTLRAKGTLVPPSPLSLHPPPTTIRRMIEKRSCSSYTRLSSHRPRC